MPHDRGDVAHGTFFVRLQVDQLEACIDMQTVSRGNICAWSFAALRHDVPSCSRWMNAVKRRAVTYNAYNTVFPSEAGKEDSPALMRCAEKKLPFEMGKSRLFLEKLLTFWEKSTIIINNLFQQICRKAETQSLVAKQRNFVCSTGCRLV